MQTDRLHLGCSRRPHDDLTDDDAFLEETERMKQFASHHLSSSPEHLDLPPDAVAALCSRHLVEGNGNLPSVPLVRGTACKASHWLCMLMQCQMRMEKWRH